MFREKERQLKNLFKDRIEERNGFLITKRKTKNIKKY